jgi:hypothetical protein
VAVTAAGNRVKKSKACLMPDITVLPIDYYGYGYTPMLQNNDFKGEILLYKNYIGELGLF